MFTYKKGRHYREFCGRRGDTAGSRFHDFRWFFRSGGYPETSRDTPGTPSGTGVDFSLIF